MTTSPDQLRVAFFTETFVPNIDGIVRVTCRLLDHLRATGAKAIVFSPGDHPESYAGFPVVSIPGKPFPIYPEMTMGVPGRSELNRLIDFNPTLIHAISPAIAGLQGMRFAHRLRVPLVASFQTHVMEIAGFYGLGVLKEPLWAAHRFAYNRANYRLAPSIGMIEELHTHGFKPVMHWRRGVDTAAFSPTFADAEVRAQLSNGQPDKVLLLSVGRLAPEKQVERLAAVLDAVPNTHLVIVGDGPHRAKLEAAFSGRSVTFTGYLTGEALSRAYASCDMFVFPTSKIETFGLVAIEAMAAGLAVVSSRVGGIPELIEQGRNGYMFEPNDSAQMIAYVRELVENPDARREIATAARATAEQRSWGAVMDELLQNYCAMVDQYRPPQLHRSLIRAFAIQPGR